VSRSAGHGVSRDCFGLTGMVPGKGGVILVVRLDGSDRFRSLESGQEKRGGVVVQKGGWKSW
jgi:hypothetical protein